MPFIVDGKIVDLNPKVEPEVEHKPQPRKVPAPTTAVSTRSANGSIMVVNGKEMKIGKKSPYLLDMFTIDDDI